MLSISIQSGGGSTRMGQDKALLPFLEVPLIQRVIDRVNPLADELIVTTNTPQAYRFLGVPLFNDIHPGVGALGGLHTALVRARYPMVAVVACDLPFANPVLLAACRDILMESGTDAVIPASEHGLEPLHAVYRKTTCLPLIETAIKAGKRRMIAWHEDAMIQVIPPEVVKGYDPHGISFWNVNTPDEFHRAETVALEIEQNTRP